MKSLISSFFLLVLISQVSNGQSLEMVKALGDSALSQRSWNTARTAYERVLFFDSTGNYKKKIYPKLGLIYYTIGNYQQSYTYYQLAYNIANQVEIKSKLALRESLSALANHDYFSAIIATMKINSTNQTINRERDLIQAISFYQLDKMEEAYARFEGMCSTQQCLNAFSVLKKEVQKTSKKKPKKARTLGIIIPGGGYFYMGAWKPGLNSFLLLGGLFTLYYYSAATTTMLNATLNVLPWYQRYFMGTYTNAESLAKHLIYVRKQESLLNFLDQLPPSELDEEWFTSYSN